MGDELTISREEVFEALVNKFPDRNIEVLNYQLDVGGDRIGLLGEHGFLTATVNLKTKEEPARTFAKNVKLFVKFFPRNEPAHFCRETGAFTKEIFVYNLLNRMADFGVKNVFSCVSKCYLAREEKLLVFDDLMKEGFETLDKCKLLDYDTVLVALRSLAKLHASSLIYEEKMSEKFGRNYRLIDEYEKNLEDTFFNDREGFINKKGVEASMKCTMTEIDLFKFHSKLKSGKDFKETATDVLSQIYKIVKPSNKYRNVLCHGDLWHTNFLIKYSNSKPIDCKLVDFQVARYSPPSHDVMSLLYLTCSREFRKKYMYELLGIYYANLEKNVKLSGYDLSKIIPFNQFMDSCEEQKLFAVLQSVNYFPLILADAKVVEDFFKDKELFEKTFMDDRSVLLLAYIDKDDHYRCRLEESILDLKDYCEKL